VSSSTTTICAVLRRQIDPTLQMLADIVESCPDSLWTDSRTGRPFWQQVIHALTGVRLWLREASQPFSPPDFGQGPVPDLDQMPSFAVDRLAVKKYLQAIQAVVDSFFTSVDDSRLLLPSSVYDRFTDADLILMQIRHLQHHIGYCNCLLQVGHAKPAKWLGYAE
jgi:DinB superfamily